MKLKTFKDAAHNEKENLKGDTNEKYKWGQTLKMQAKLS